MAYLDPHATQAYYNIYIVVREIDSTSLSYHTLEIPTTNESIDKATRLGIISHVVYAIVDFLNRDDVYCTNAVLSPSTLFSDTIDSNVFNVANALLKIMSVASVPIAHRGRRATVYWYNELRRYVVDVSAPIGWG
jgi:hypothetical protein